MKRTIAIISLSLGSLTLVGCPSAEEKKSELNPCDQATVVVEDECGIEVDDPDEDEEVACEGEVREYAECIVDNNSAFCAFLDDPTRQNAYTDCVNMVE